MPPATLFEWRNRGQNLIYLNFGQDKSNLDVIDRLDEFQGQLIKALSDAGVMLLAGTYCTALPGMVWGYTLHQEIEMLTCKSLTLLVILGLALMVFNSVQASPPLLQKTSDARLDAVVEKALRQHNVPGASVAVLKNGKVVWAKGYGMADDGLQGARKTGDHRGFKPIIVMDLVEKEGIAIMANSDRAAIGFLIDIACARSKNVDGNLMQSDCGELYMLRNGQLGLAALLTLGTLVYVALVVRSICAGRRQLRLDFTRGKPIRLAILVIIPALWWMLWHTDLLLTRIVQRYPCCGYAVTVRAVVPWPTAFVWISRAVTLWFVVWIAMIFAPKVKKPMHAGTPIL